MKKFIFGILILIASVWLGLKMAEDPGLAFFSYRDWSVEMPLWFAILSFIILVVVLYFVLRLFDSIDASFYRWRNWLRWRRKNKSYSKTNRGLIELIEGHWRVSENYLLEGIDQSDAPLINYLAAAKAAHERKAYDKRDLYLRKAHDIAPNAEVAIGLTQAKLQFEQGQLEQSLATLNRLRHLAPLHPLVLRMIEKLFIRLADWPALLKLIPSLRKAKLFTTEQVDKLEQHVYEELLKSAANKSDGLNAARELWQQLPRKLHKNLHLVSCFVTQLLRYPGTGAECEELINSALKKEWNASLVHQYGLLVTNDAKKQLAHAEKWLKSYNHQPILLLTLGRLCVRCQLWGKARGYFEDSLKLEASAETHAEYGQLLDRLGDVSAALAHYQEGLKLSVSAHEKSPCFT